jgi:N-acetylneuraminic acid mutarotase
VKLGQALGTASSKGNLSVFSPGVKLTFTERASVPETIDSLDQGITIGRDMYVGVTYDKKVFKYSITEDSWSTLPLAPVSYARIGCLNKKVLVLGGRLSFIQITADIHEFDEASQQWVRSTSIPPMPTARSSATIVSWSSPPALIVFGGRNQRNQPMTVVEVYYGRTSQWHTVTQLPFPRANVTHTVIHNVLYLVGGYEGTGMTSYKKTVLSILIPQLLESNLQSSPKLWQDLSITNIPNYISAAASLGGCLLVVGGVKDPGWPPKPESVVSSVHAYCPSTSSWVLVGELPQPLYHCITATLPTGELLVMGGMTPSVAATNTTFKCSLSVSL